MGSLGGFQLPLLCMCGPFTDSWAGGTGVGFDGAGDGGVGGTVRGGSWLGVAVGKGASRTVAVLGGDGCLGSSCV